MNDRQDHGKSASTSRKSGYTTLIFSIILAAGLPIVLLPFCCWLLDTYPSFFGRIWHSKYDIGGRLWLLASFASTLLITGRVVALFIEDHRYDCLRADTSFTGYAKAVIAFVFVLPFLGIGALFIPASIGGVWWMKGLAFTTAGWMWFCDVQMLKVVNRVVKNPGHKDQTLCQDFEETVRLIDRPTTGAVALIIVVALIYLYWGLPKDPNSASSNEIFVMGLSAGAVAVEIWFANLLFWLLFRKHQALPIGGTEHVNTP